MEIDKKLCGQNILLCVVNIPPESSPYSSMDMFDDLENQFLESEMFCNGAEICMLGGFNGRTAQLSDILEKDDHVNRVSSVSEMFDCLNNAVCDLPNVELKRCSSDSCTNNYGYRLVVMCKNMGVVIVNGRFGADRGVGKTTCDGKSVVDYILCSPKLLYYIICFEVDDFCYLRSDKHNALNMTLKSKNLKTDKDQDAVRGNVTRTKWKDELENDFIQAMNEDQINSINQSINEMTEKLDGYDEVDQQDIDSLVGNMRDCFNHAAVKAKVTYKVEHRKWKRTVISRKWFNKDCEQKRKEYFQSKHRYQVDQNERNRDAYKKVDKEYKKQLKRACREHYRSLNTQLKILKTSNARQYWAILNRMCN